MSGRDGLHLALITHNPVRIGGMQTFTRFLVRTAIAAGHRVTVAVSGEDIYEPWHGLRLCVERVDWIDENRAGDREYHLSRVRERRRWFARIRPDLALFVQSSNTPFRASVLGARCAGVPVITTHRTMPYVIPPTGSRRHFFGLVPGIGLHRKRLIARTWLTAALASRIVYNSEAVRTAYEADYRYPRHKGVVIPNAIDAEHLAIVAAETFGHAPRSSAHTKKHGTRADARAASSTRPVIGFVGRLGREKRLDILLRAASSVPAPANVVLCGDGPERPTLEQLAAELGMGGRVEFRGETSDVAAAYAGMDIVVLTSPREASSNMILEAMAAGQAVVVTCVGGMPELVANGRCGLVVPPLDVDALRDALYRLITDEPLRREIGRRAAEHVRARHAESRVAAAWLHLFEQVARRAHRVCRTEALTLDLEGAPA